MRNRKSKTIQFESGGSYLKFLINPITSRFHLTCENESLSCVQLQSSRFLRPWDSPGNNPGVCCHSLLQEIFPTQGSNSGLLHCRQILHLLSPPGKPLFDLGKTIYSMIQSQTNELCFAWNSYIMSCLLEREISSLVRLERD